MLAIAGYLLATAGGPPSAPPSVTPPLPGSPPPRPPVAWLGLNYNSATASGALAAFARRGIIYDREGAIQVNAGMTPENTPQFKAGLEIDYSAGMIPVIELDPASGPPGCPNAPDPSHTCLPTTVGQISALVSGLVQTAASVVRAHPGQPVLFEPLDEPWGWASPPGTPPGARAAAEYADLLARLLPAAHAAGVPLSDFYVAAIGRLGDGTDWVADLYRAQPCLAPGAGSCGPIQGWYLHPYGPPGHSDEGIGAVPGIRAAMRSGRDNLIVSEIGFCATDVHAGQACGNNRPDIDGTSPQVAAWLTQTLVQAAAMHRAGWLKALLVWERSGTGWAMQNTDGTVTAQGRALDLFGGLTGRALRPSAI